jgi:hypothetical protein
VRRKGAHIIRSDSFTVVSLGENPGAKSTKCFERGLIVAEYSRPFVLQIYPVCVYQGLIQEGPRNPTHPVWDAHSNTHDSSIIKNRCTQFGLSKKMNS